MAFTLFKSNRLLTLQDLHYLSKLLNNHLPINECFDLLRNKNNEKIFDCIKIDLSNGEIIEKIITSYVSKDIKTYLDVLLKQMSFSDALNLSLQFIDKQNEDHVSLISSIAYPVILMFITITSLYLFDLYGMDSMFNMMKDFSSDINIYQHIRIILRIVVKSIYYGFLLIVLLFIYLKQPKRIVILYLFISKYFVNSLFNIYFCEQFMSLLLICHKQGFKTKESLQILKSTKSKPIISFLAFHLDDALMKGDSLKQAASQKYYDSSLARYIKLANYTNDFEEIISSYLMVTKQRIKSKMKEYAITIQLCNYALIGTVIIFIYQLLFMPMQAITMF